MPQRTSRAQRRAPSDGRIEAEVAQRSSNRAKALFWVTIVLAGYLGWRLYDVQVRSGPALAARALDQRSARYPVNAMRGAIYSSDGVLLARKLPSHDVHPAPADMKDVGKIAFSLAPIVHEPEQTIATEIGLARTDHAIARNVSDAQDAAIVNLTAPGVAIGDDPRGGLFAPSGRLASTILGFCGRDRGLEGVEFNFDGLLRGTPGVRSVETDGYDRSLPFAKPRWIVQPRAGDNIVLTLDSYLQYATQRALQRTVAQYGAASGTAIVMDPNTGALLAVANAPDYDVNHFSHYPAEDRRDRAVTDAYEPGSTFKLVMASAALESHVVTTASRFPARD